jgi:hypothetical protein
VAPRAVTTALQSHGGAGPGCTAQTGTGASCRRWHWQRPTVHGPARAACRRGGDDRSTVACRSGDDRPEYRRCRRAGPRAAARPRAGRSVQGSRAASPARHTGPARRPGVPGQSLSDRAAAARVTVAAGTVTVTVMVTARLPLAGAVLT